MDERFEIVGALALMGEAGHQQDAHLGMVFAGLERERDAVQARHDDVGEKELEALLGERRERGRAICHRPHVMTAVAERMMGEMGGGRPDGTDPGEGGPRQADRDPLGRLNPQDHANGGVDEGGRMRLGDPVSNYAVEKAKGILEELRRRAGERARPEIERDYIDRLLKQF